MTALVPKFWYGHEFWQTAFDMRQNNFTLREIYEKAQKEGHSDLTYNNIGKGLRNAQADAAFPAHASQFLKKRYAQISDGFDSYATMKYLIQDGLRDMFELEEQLADPNISMSTEETLKTTRWRLAERLFQWSRSCSEIEVKMGTIAAIAPVVNTVEDAVASREAVQAEVNKLMEQLKSSSRVNSVDQIKNKFGIENIKMPGDLGRSRDVDEEEDI